MVTDIRALDIYGPDIKERRAEITETAIGLIRDLVTDTGAECVVPLGGALIPYVVDTADLQEGAGVPVLNTKAVLIRFAEACVGLGMSHSPLTYPRAELTCKDLVAEV